MCSPLNRRTITSAELKLPQKLLLPGLRPWASDIGIHVARQFNEAVIRPRRRME
jgi:hypothetical protein